jgi:MFS-type transporter involved in bile tolerance (Atg22 family)
VKHSHSDTRHGTNMLMLVIICENGSNWNVVTCVGIMSASDVDTCWTLNTHSIWSVVVDYIIASDNQSSSSVVSDSFY